MQGKAGNDSLLVGYIDHGYRYLSVFSVSRSEIFERTRYRDAVSNMTRLGLKRSHFATIVSLRAPIRRFLGSLLANRNFFRHLDHDTHP